MGIYGCFTNVQMSKCADMQMPFASITPITGVTNYGYIWVFSTNTSSRRVIANGSEAIPDYASRCFDLDQ